MDSSPSSSQKRPVASVAIRPGDVLSGKFRVGRIVGRGGMGVVVEATNIQLDQRVAVKLLLAGGGGEQAMVERFTGEARAAARLRSEHVARVHDVGSDEVHGPFIVMELLEGQNLADLVATSGRLPVHRAVEHLIDACEGLAEAHARGIIHQDVKPANLFVVTGSDGRPSVKVLDFGLAAMRSVGNRKDAKSSSPALGTPAYLAPEQLRAAGAVDHRADVWALGCVLHELLAGSRAWPATRFTELVTMILEAGPAPLPAGVELPSGVADAIARCLEKDPERRFASTGALALALLPFARPRAHAAVAKAVAHAKASGLDPGLEMPSSMPPPPPVDSEPRLPSSLELRAPRPPSNVGATSGVVLREATAGATGAAATSDVDAAAARPPVRSRGLVLFLLAGLVGVLGAVALWRILAPAPRESPRAVLSATAPAFATAATASAPADTGGSAPEASHSPPAGAGSVGAGAPSVAPAVSARAAPGHASALPPRGPWPPPARSTRPTASSPPSSPPAPTESDIHHAR